jgi:tellurite resistance protein
MSVARLRKLVDVRPVTAQTRSLPNLDLHVPEEDANEPDCGDALVANALSRFLAIEYVDAKNQESRRRITVLNVQKKGDDYLVNAMCHERGAMRSFRASRIRLCFDPNTGEVFEDVFGFLERRLLLSEPEIDPTAEATRRALQKFAPELSILVYLARCDGDYAPSEREAIMDFLQTAVYPASIDFGMASNHILSLEPCSAAVFEALDVIENEPPRRQKLLLDAVRAVVEADGELTPAEFEMLMEMREANDFMAMKNR